VTVPVVVSTDWIKRQPSFYFRDLVKSAMASNLWPGYERFTPTSTGHSSWTN